MKDRVAFVTGAARGQGRNHCLRLAEAGARIIGLDLCGPVSSVGYPLAEPDDLARTVELVRSAGGDMLSFVGDVRDRSAVDFAVAEGIAAFGHLDVVVANAGILPIVGEQATTMQAYTDAVDINLTGVFHTVEAALPALIAQGTGGSVVITSSTSGLVGLADGSPGSMGYAAAKHGVVGLMRSWATVHAQHSIRFNTVHPTGVASPMVENAAFGRYVDEHPEMVPRLRNAMPVALIDLDDVSSAALWLASDGARYVTGTTVSVDAGFCLR